MTIDELSYVAAAVAIYAAILIVDQAFVRRIVSKHSRAGWRFLSTLLGLALTALVFAAIDPLMDAEGHRLMLYLAGRFGAVAIPSMLPLLLFWFARDRFAQLRAWRRDRETVARSFQ